MEEMRKQPSKLEGPKGAPLGEVIGAVLTVEIGKGGFWDSYDHFSTIANLGLHKI